MKPNSLIENALVIINNRGKFAVDEGCQKILQSQFGKGVISAALNYYAKAILPSVLPIFPALILLSCKAVGGNPEKTKSLAVAMMLVTASGDIHDDIIDNSTHKFRRKTVFGKYGRDITLLVGDVLLIQGMTLLQKNCESLTVEQRMIIADLIAKSMIEIVKAESIETCLWKKTIVTPQEYFEVIRLKGDIAELHCKIGGIVGCADEKALVDIAQFGKVIGILSTMKEEFTDLLNSSELEHRIKNELPPYPMLYAFQNERIKKQIIPIIRKTEISQKDLHFISKTILNSLEVQKLRAELRVLGENELANNALLKNNGRARELAVLARALTVEL